MSNSDKPARIAYSISEFCEAAGFSRSFYYLLPADKRPREVRVGKRRLITVEAAKAWLSQEIAA